MADKRFPSTQLNWRPAKPKKMRNPVSKVTQVAGRRMRAPASRGP